MQSFRTELENPVVEKDIIELEEKISLFNKGKIDQEKFRSLRLARGVYGQRQEGVQMIRIKLPFGKVTAQQLRTLADVSDEYSNGNLHITTRQDIQIHYVSLDRTPELWAQLESSDITLREACGNTVRNITASEDAGIHPDEPFDVSPYAYATFKYFLRHPIQQDLGRKIKISFSSTENDSAYSFIHDLGFIPKIKNGLRGFKVLIGGGLGAQPLLAQIAHEFLPEDELIPFIEGLIRVFDRYGERSKRFKARLKYILKDIGIEQLLKRVEDTRSSWKYQKYPIDHEVWRPGAPKSIKDHYGIKYNEAEYALWKRTNTFEQKQKGYYGVYANVQLGNFNSDKARKVADLVDEIAADDIRLTIGQNFLIKFVRPEALPYVFEQLKALGFAKPGHGSVADITSCPGTDTCNLGISNSTQVAKELEKLIHSQYKELLHNNDIKIKISGCMNSCGQHGLANIGWHGSSLKKEDKILPALQILLGGGNLGDGNGRVGQKVIKIPSKRGPEALRFILDDYQDNHQEGEYFNTYFDRNGKDYFYQLLKPLANLETLTPADYLDWGQEETFARAVGLGECAGVVIDLVATLIYEAEEKLAWSQEAFEKGLYADAIYNTYASMLSGAKALLLKEEIKTNTHRKIISDFQTYFVATKKLDLNGFNFEAYILQIDHNVPSEEFAQTYLNQGLQFFNKVKALK